MSTCVILRQQHTSSFPPSLFQMWSQTPSVTGAATPTVTFSDIYTSLQPLSTVYQPRRRLHHILWSGKCRQWAEVYSQQLPALHHQLKYNAVNVFPPFKILCRLLLCSSLKESIQTTSFQEAFVWRYKRSTWQEVFSDATSQRLLLGQNRPHPASDEQQ